MSLAYPARPRVPMLACVVFAMLGAALSAGCGDDDGGVSPDAALPDAGADAATTGPAAVAPPAGLRCPAGLLATTLASGLPSCARDPAEPLCADAEARFYDTASCAAVGPVCPSGPFAEPPAAGRVVYAVPSAESGGDGTFARPYATVREALSGAIVGTTVMLGQGTFVEGGLIVPRGVTLRGACAAGTIVTATDIAVPTAVIIARAAETRVESLTIGPSSGLGLQVEGGAMTLQDVVIHDATTAAVSVVNGTLGGNGLVVRRTQPDVDFGDSGFAIFAETGAIVDLDRAVFEHNGDTGVLAVAGARVTLRHVAVRDADGAPSATRGIAVSAQAGGEIVLEGGEIAGHGHGSLLATEGGRLTARDVVVLDSRGSAPGSGFGADAELTSTIELERVLIDRAERTGVLLRDASSLLATDVLIHQVGIGMIGDSGSNVQVTRMEIDAPSSGVSFVGPDVSIALSDLTVRGATGAADGGFGVAITRGGTLTVTRAAIIDTVGIGLGLNGVGSVGVATDLVVRDTRSYGALEQWGRGIDLAAGAQLTVTRARFEGNREVQVAAFGAATRLELAELSILQSLPRSCAMTSCTDAPGGSAIGAYDGSTVVARAFVVDSAALCGLQVANDGALDVSDGVIRGAVVGACVQVPGYDITRLAGTVIYADNGVNIDAMSVPVPMPLDLSAF